MSFKATVKLGSKCICGGKIVAMCTSEARSPSIDVLHAAVCEDCSMMYMDSRIGRTCRQIIESQFFAKPEVRWTKQPPRRCKCCKGLNLTRRLHGPQMSVTKYAHVHCLDCLTVTWAKEIK